MTSTGADSVPPVDRRRHDRTDVLSTSLLLDLTTITVDPAYVEAAARRSARGEQPRGASRRYAAALSLALIGLVGALAFRQNGAAAPQAARVRGALVARVHSLTKETDVQARLVGRLREQVARNRDTGLATTAADRALAAAVRSLEFAAGSAAAAGPGLTVRLADARSTGSAQAARVQDRDLQRAVNIAWSAGATAVAVNGQRVGALTAIRQAGDLILVDYRPVISPYEIRAIGDQAALENAFTTSEVSNTLRESARSLDFTFDVKRSSKLELSGTGVTRTTVARPVDATNVQKGSSAP